MNKPLLCIVAVLFLGFGLRLYPTIISGMPFSTDAWPLIRNTQILLQQTPLPLTSSLFDGYNNYWPLSQIYGATLAQTANVPATVAMAIGVPLAAALTLPLFFVLSKRITQNTKIALLSTALLATAFPYTLFNAGVTKETFACPIYISLLLLFILKHDWKTTTLFTIASVALVFAHHLTAFLTLGVLASLTVASFFVKTKPQANSGKSNLLYLGILGVATGLYFGLYAYGALPITITASDLLTLAAYQALTITAVLYTIYLQKRPSPAATAFKCFLGLGLMLFSFFLLATVNVFSGTPLLPTSYLLFALPLILSVPLSILALNQLPAKSTNVLLPVFWLLPLIAFMLYAIFANLPDGVGFATRSINFILPPLLILVASGVYKLSTMRSRVRLGVLAKVLALGLVFSIGALNVYSLYATVSLQEPYLGYFWRYEPSEYNAADWASTYGNNQSVAGDAKVSYLLGGYFGQNVSVLEGLRFFADNSSAPQVLYVYSGMYQNGYVLYQGSPVALPLNWTSKLADYDMIYGNSEVTIYAKR